MKTLIAPGDKIDINFLHQNKGKNYKSSVFDIIGDNLKRLFDPSEANN